MIIKSKFNKIDKVIKLYIYSIIYNIYSVLRTHINYNHIVKFVKHQNNNPLLERVSARCKQIGL